MSEIDEIKSKLDIIDIINRYLPLKKRGRHHVACCPFHHEKTPSFTVSPELQIFKCFGCGKSGDMFTFVQEFEKVDFREALEDLAALAGVKLTRSEGYSQEDAQRKRLFELNIEINKFYHYILLSHPLGKSCLEYLQNRGIKMETIKLFKIGFSPPNPSLISQYLFKKGFNKFDLIASGTFGESQYHSGQLYDRFQDRLVFPLIDSRDKIIGFSGRIIPNEQSLPAGRQANLAKYINSPETLIYHKSHTVFGIHLAKDAIKKSNSVIVVEGEFDMISPYQSGIKNIVAIKGTAFTADQLQLLRRYTDTLILGLDSDFAGNNAARKSIELADSMEFDIKVINLSSEFKDPDEAVKKDPAIFQAAVDTATTIWDYIIKSTVASNDLTTIKGKRAILSIVLPFLSKIKNEVIRSDYLTLLASAIGSSAESVKAEAAKVNHPSVIINPPQLKSTEIESTNISRLEDQLLSLVFSARKPIKLIKNIIIDYTFVTAKNIAIVQHLRTRKKFIPTKFALTLAPEIAPTFHSIYLNGTILDLDAHHRQIEIKKTLSQLLTFFYKEKLNQLSLSLSKAETDDDEVSIKKIESEYNFVLSKLSKLQVIKS